MGEAVVYNTNKNNPSSDVREGIEPSVDKQAETRHGERRHREEAQRGGTERKHLSTSIQVAQQLGEAQCPRRS